MSTTFVAPLGDRGRLVLPAKLRASQNWEQGDSLVLVETSKGVLIATRRQALDLLRDQLAGESLVQELICERRQASKAEQRGDE